MDKVTDFLLLLGKLVIVGGVGVASFYIFSGKLSSFALYQLFLYVQETTQQQYHIYEE